MIDTNVKGLIYVSRTVLPFMVDQNSVHVLNIGSTAGAGAYAKGAVYCASKAAVKTISEASKPFSQRTLPMPLCTAQTNLVVYKSLISRSW